MILLIVTIYYYGFITTFLLSFVVVVAEKSRGKKIGKKMMLDVEGWAKDKGFNCFYVSPYKAAEIFYTRCGYVDFDCLYMVKKVTENTVT